MGSMPDTHFLSIAYGRLSTNQPLLRKFLRPRLRCCLSRIIVVVFASIITFSISSQPALSGRVRKKGKKAKNGQLKMLPHRRFQSLKGRGSRIQSPTSLEVINRNVDLESPTVVYFDGKRLQKDSIRKASSISGRLQQNRLEEAERFALKSGTLQKINALEHERLHSPVVHRRVPRSESAQSHREFESIENNHRFRPSSGQSYLSERSLSVQSQRLHFSSHGKEDIAWSERCLAARYGDEQSFRSPLTYLESKLQEIETLFDLTAADSNQDRIDVLKLKRIPALCEILGQSLPSMGRIGSLLKRIMNELLASIFVEWQASNSIDDSLFDFSRLSTYVSGNLLQLQVICSLQVWSTKLPLIKNISTISQARVLFPIR
jgi:hypothetical protein